MLGLTEHYPGPRTTALPADLGADVALIERSGGGDPARKVESLFTSLRRNMRRIVLDLESPGGQQHLSQLSATADVLGEGCRPGVMHKFRSSYKEVKANRGLIYLSVTGFGQSGQYRRRPTQDLSCQGLAGVLFYQRRTGYRFNYPLMISLQVPWRRFGVVWQNRGQWRRYMRKKQPTAYLCARTTR
ncbi:CoA transferase [Mesorhizobium sp. M0129]|uniref:CoA transferase n=1 Tax=Mesorhizobium sp. M0129 TaxID=2956886 RepID=UPI0033389175